ncbi:hypothetical protein A4A49_51914 [Nicotiana attenuata]|uniref:RNase H type-1 domain-containing protein n=1 Tax=Nicotiana attenuata TaxID=49451 RepID=A0A1J6HYW7_NICAT|nr:hypothetical protein A4A49_51914 [Nicotiana attenuata]
MGFAGSLPTFNSLIAEMQALLQGLKLAVQMQLMPPKVELDAKEVINLLTKDHPLYTNILCDGRHPLQYLHDLMVLHAYKEQNRVIENLAKYNIQMESNAATSIFEASPLFVSRLLLEDKLGLTTIRVVPPTAGNVATTMDTNITFDHQSKAGLAEVNSFLTTGLVELAQSSTWDCNTNHIRVSNSNLAATSSTSSVCNMVPIHQHLYTHMFD